MHPKEIAWPFDGVFGKVDKQAAQRGFQVYKEVCAACHSLDRIAFRNMTALGFSEGEAKALAAEYQVTDGPNDEGEMFQRPGRISDYFVPPYPNEKASRAANGGAYPPDLSLIVKARKEGPDYIYSLLTGYGEAPQYSCKTQSKDGRCILFGAPVAGEDIFTCASITTSEVKNEETDKITLEETCVEMGTGMNYNPYFPGHQIAMPAPLSDGRVTYEDGTVATVDQMSRDVVTFLQWTAEPEMEERKRMGIRTLLFLGILTIVLYFAKKRVWRDLH